MARFALHPMIGVALFVLSVGVVRAEVGVWMTAAELARLPMSGPAWEALKAQADLDPGTAHLADQDLKHDVNVLAIALVYARTGDEAYRQRAILEIMEALETENGGRTLALGRNLVSYVIAADLVGLPPDDAQRFRAWLDGVRTEMLDGRSLISTHEDRPNNWGTHAGASRAAAAMYLGDTEDLARTAQVFRGWLGNRAVYAGFKYGADLSWQCHPEAPVGINPRGCLKAGHVIDGVLADDQRRCGSFGWPPCLTNYTWEGLQGALVQAVILYRAGYDAFDWEDKALLRAAEWLYNEANFPAEGDDTWQPHLLNFFYGTNFPAPVPSRPGKNMGWTDWTHQGTLSVVWVTPQHGASVSGVVPIQIVAPPSETPPELLTVEWHVDDSGTWHLAIYNTDTGYYEDTWESTSSADGQHRLTARIINGNTITELITVQTENTDDAPIVSWTHPKDDDTIKGTVTVKIHATDDRTAPDVLTVMWRVDAGSWQPATYNAISRFYEASWDTTTVANRTYTLEAQATDAAGHVSWLATLMTTVYNPPGNTDDLYVWSITWSEKYRGRANSITDLNVTVAVRQDTDADATASSGDTPVANAIITLRLTLDTDADGMFEPGTDDTFWTFQATTHGNGQASFTHKSAAKGNYQAEVTALTHAAFTWNAALDVDNPDAYCGVPSGQAC